jgi:hypothetical protein
LILNNTSSRFNNVRNNSSNNTLFGQYIDNYHNNHDDSFLYINNNTSRGLFSNSNMMRPQPQQQRINVLSQVNPLTGLPLTEPNIVRNLLNDSLIVYKITGALSAWALLNKIPFGMSFSKIIY